MNYLGWNTKIAEHFFSQDKAGRKIYLFVTQELIEQLGQPQGIGFSDFVEAVKTGPPWVRAAGLCHALYRPNISGGSATQNRIIHLTSHIWLCSLSLQASRVTSLQTLIIRAYEHSWESNRTLVISPLSIACWNCGTT